MPMLPSSSTPKYVVTAGVAGAVIAAALIALAQIPPFWGTFLLLISCGAPMWWLEMRRFPPQIFPTESIAPWRGKLRLLGVFLVLVLFFSVYTISTKFLTMLSKPDVLGDMLGVLIFASVPWFLWMLRRRPRGVRLDCLELLGSALFRRIVKKRKLKEWHYQTLLSWCVKLYFLPIMLGSCYFFIYLFCQSASNIKIFSGFSLFLFIFYFLYAIDTAFATVGYLSTSRRVNGYIRSTDSTALGWLVTLVCYPPFNYVVLHQWLSYKDGYEWNEWLADNPVLFFVWGSVVLLLTVGYVWSTVSFGLRFSNLSYRGLLSSGPYKYFKHPSYFFKNISWWLISIPFISLEGGIVAFFNCLGLIGVNCIYALRAWTEERHLASEPDYRAYSKWMAEYGVFARFRRLIGW